MVFVGAMKNFKHMLMGQEIFLKIFDGPQNIFLCTPLVNMQTGYQGDLRKVTH